MNEKNLENAWTVISEQQNRIHELIRSDEAHENNIGRLWEKIADLNHYINQLESKHRELENDLDSLRYTVNRLEGI